MDVIVNSTQEELEHPGAIIIDYHKCMRWAKEVMTRPDYTMEPEVIPLATLVFDDIEVKEDTWQTMGDGVLHMLARIDMTLTLRTGHSLVWKNPETSIYPKYHANIVDLMIEMDMFSKKTGGLNVSNSDMS